MILEKIRTLLIGYFKGIFQHKKYDVTRTDYNNSNSIKIDQERQDEKNFISFNYVDYIYLRGFKTLGNATRKNPYKQLCNTLEKLANNNNVGTSGIV